jgi:hypothetical protein
MSATLTPLKPTAKRGDLVAVVNRQGGDEHLGRVIRVVLIPSYYDPKAAPMRYYRVEGLGLLVPNADIEVL